MRIYAMTKKRISPEVNAISTLLFAVVILLLIIINVRSIRQEKAEAKRLRAFRRDAFPSFPLPAVASGGQLQSHETV